MLDNNVEETFVIEDSHLEAEDLFGDLENEYQ